MSNKPDDDEDFDPDDAPDHDPYKGLDDDLNDHTPSSHSHSHDDGGDDDDDSESGGGSHDDFGTSKANHTINPDGILAKPTYRDGISTHRTYLILATRKKQDDQTYNCVCQGNDKIKFYPNKEFFGITNEDLLAVDINLHTKEKHHGYERYICSRAQAAKLLTIVANTRNTISVSPNMVMDAPSNGFQADQDEENTERRTKMAGGHGFPSGVKALDEDDLEEYKPPPKPVDNDDTF